MMFIHSFAINLFVSPSLSVLSNTDCSQPQPLSCFPYVRSLLTALSQGTWEQTYLAYQTPFLPKGLLILVLLIQM